MRATVTTAFRGVRDGETQPRSFGIGSLIEGDLARAMVDAGYAIQDKAHGAAPQNKGVAGGGSENPPGGLTGRGKPASSSPRGQAQRTRRSK